MIPKYGPWIILFECSWILGTQIARKFYYLNRYWYLFPFPPVFWSLIIWPNSFYLCKLFILSFGTKILITMVSSNMGQDYKFPEYSLELEEKCLHFLSLKKDITNYIYQWILSCCFLSSFKNNLLCHYWNNHFSNLGNLNKNCKNWYKFTKL